MYKFLHLDTQPVSRQVINFRSASDGMKDVRLCYEFECFEES